MVSALVVGTNTYETLAEANTILGDLIHTQAWGDQDDDTKKLALITAFTDLSQLSLVDPGTGQAIDPSNAPQPIKQAQAELAFIYTQDASAATAGASGATNIRRVKADTAEVEFFRPLDGSKFSSRIMNLLKPYLSGGSSTSVSGSLASGSCARSSFDDDDELTLNEGFA